MFRQTLVAGIAALALSALIGSSSPAEAANCGANDQRPCTIIERIPSCDKGLYEDFGKGKCLRKHVAGQTCGRKNQVPCPIWVRVPSCNTGLVENFARGLCVQPATGVRPGIDCGRLNQRPCTIVERIPSCNEGLVEDFSVNKCLAKAVPGRDCGNVNQRPCKLWERVPSCNANLKEDFARGICVAVDCGKENGRPCTVVERIPSCDSGLVEDFLKGKCVKSEDAKRQEIAGRKLAEIAGFVASKLNFAQQVAYDPAVRNALKSNSPESVSRAVNISAVGPTQMPDGSILRTLTIGASVDAKVIFGGSAGAGGTYDIGRRLPPYAYATADYSITFGFGAEAGVDVGLWVCQANKIGGDSWGVEFGPRDILALAKVLKGVEGAKISDILKPGFDIGVTLWFGYDGSLQGFTMTFGVGAGADVGGVVFATTGVQDDPNVNCDGTPVNGSPVTPPVNVISAPFGGTLPVYIQEIRYSGAYGDGVIRHQKIPGGAKNRNFTRVCLTNSTGNPKSLNYTVRGVNPLNAAGRGDQSCANFPSNMRLTFGFVDRRQTVKPDAMNLSAYAGDIVSFEWIRD